MTPFRPKQNLSPILYIIFFGLTACSLDIGSTPVAVPSPTLVLSPTSTPIPVAVSINGEDITAAEFEVELARYQQAQTGMGNTVSLETATQVVLDDMINSLLLEQGAAAVGFIVDDATLQSRIEALSAQMGGPDALTAWESSQGYTDAEFRSALRRQIAAAWMRDEVIGSISSTTEQVHVKQILFYNQTDAEQALGYLQSGWNFIDLAAQYDPVTTGELGWFPRGYIPSLAIEEAAFALQPGQYSAIIQDEAGFHLIYVEDREPARLLSPDALVTLQEKAVQSWLIQRRNESAILYAP
jgi:peptidyl-prolyl cis-trans isomerase C